jgi:hypothetical protein
MMRSSLLLALLLSPLAAEEDLELLRMRRLAMEAQLKIGDVLRQQGDLEGAQAAYEEALRLGGRPRGGPAVAAALRWLAAHQDDDGGFDCDDFMKHDPPGDKCDGAGGAHYDTGVTGLAVLAFLRAGRDRERAAKGLEYLRQWQDDEGCFGRRASQHFMYNHAIATLAMCEAFRLTRDERWKEPARKGLDYLMLARNPHLAWRYEPRGGENDTSVTAWCVMALRAGERAGLAVDRAAYDGARAWVDRMTDPDFGQTGYHMRGGVPARPQGKVDAFPPERSQAMTAAGLVVRLETGEDPRTSGMIGLGRDLCLALPPRWNPVDGSIDMYYWFHATEAMARIGDHGWEAWRPALEAALLPAQHPPGSGARAGSWDPIGVWGDDGGRVYSTALLALALLAETNTRPPRDGPR